MLIFYGEFKRKGLPKTPIILSDADLQDGDIPIVDLAARGLVGTCFPSDRNEEVDVVFEYEMELFYKIVA